MIFLERSWVDVNPTSDSGNLFYVHVQPNNTNLSIDTHVTRIIVPSNADFPGGYIRIDYIIVP